MKQLSVRKIVYFQFVTVGILLFLLQFGIVSLFLYPKQAERERGLIQTQIGSEAEEIGSVFYRELGVLDVLSESYGMEERQLEEFFAFAEDFNRDFYIRVNEAARRLMLCDTEGMAFLPDREKEDLSRLNLFRVLTDPSKEGQFFSVEENMWLGSTWLYTYNRLTDNKGEHDGYLLSFFNISSILDRDAVKLFPSESTLWLMDEEGNLLWESGNRKNTVVTDEEMREKVLQFSERVREEEEGLEKLSGDGSWNVAYASVPYTSGWKLCVTWNNTGMGVQSWMYGVVSWIIWLIMMGLLLLFLLGISYKVIRPMEQLTHAIREVGSEVDQQIRQEYGIKEVDQLAKSINSMRRRILQLFQNIRQEQEAKRGAEQRVLQAQITPHFLYNTLDNISWRAMSCGDCQIYDIISALSTFFRISLSDGREFITWNDEAEHVYSYLFIQQMRYEDKLDFDIDMDQSLEKCYIIKLIIQPLVENALYHGIKPMEGRGLIQVSITALGENQIQLVVKDNGVGMSRERLEEIRSMTESGSVDAGFGLCTTVQRLKLTYGKNCIFSIDSKPGEGTLIEIILPKEKERRSNG